MEVQPLSPTRTSEVIMVLLSPSVIPAKLTVPVVAGLLRSRRDVGVRRAHVRERCAEEGHLMLFQRYNGRLVGDRVAEIDDVVVDR